jgi:hypothetical protein
VADLWVADLWVADLWVADLWVADLWGAADLWADLWAAVLCLQGLTAAGRAGQQDEVVPWGRWAV